MNAGLASLATIIVLYAALATKLSRWSITMPMVFVASGFFLGICSLRGVSLALEAETVKLLTEITLALLLFADASTLKLEQVREDAGLPARLLTAGLLLTILRGASVALMLTPGEGLAFALLLGAILAPTDAALGLPIFNNRRAPVRIRRALNIESGLNDGIANTAGGLVCPSARRGPASTRRAGRYVGTAPAPQVTHKLSNQAMNIQSAGFRANPKTERDASW